MEQTVVMQEMMRVEVPTPGVASEVDPEDLLQEGNDPLSRQR